MCLPEIHWSVVLYTDMNLTYPYVQSLASNVAEAVCKNVFLLLQGFTEFLLKTIEITQ